MPAIVIPAVTGVVVTFGSVALAGDGVGNVDCTQNASAPECEITAGTPGRGPGGSTGGSGDGGGGSGDGSGAGNSGDCYYAPVDVDLPPPAGRGPEGGWHALTCVVDGVGSQGQPVWLDQAPNVDPAALAQTARSRLRLPAPVIRTNPDADFVLVRVPVWLWMDASAWGARSATASVPGVSVTATATPVRVVWSFGDGSPDVTCDGPGRPWKSGTDPRAASPCGHTYTSSSAAAAGAVFELRATVTWSVVWSGAGSGGTLAPLVTTSAASVRVAESQAVNGGGA